jgi:hypothetical protein
MNRRKSCIIAKAAEVTCRGQEEIVVGRFNWRLVQCSRVMVTAMTPGAKLEARERPPPHEMRAGAAGCKSRTITADSHPRFLIESPHRFDSHFAVTREQLVRE